MFYIFQTFLIILRKQYNKAVTILKSDQLLHFLCLIHWRPDHFQHTVHVAIADLTMPDPVDTLFLPLDGAILKTSGLLHQA